MLPGKTAGMRTMIAVLRRVIVRRMRNHVDHRLEAIFLTERSVRLGKLLVLDNRDGRGRSCLAIEAEHVVVTAEFERGFRWQRALRCI